MHNDKENEKNYSNVIHTCVFNWVNHLEIALLVYRVVRKSWTLKTFKSCLLHALCNVRGNLLRNSFGVLHSPCDS